MASINYAPASESDIYSALILKKRELVSTEGLGWTSESPTDYGIGLLRVMAYALSLVEDFQDNRATQNYLIYAVDDEAVHAACRQLGYKMRGPVASTVLVTVTSNGSAIVPLGAKLVKTTDDGTQITFELANELVFTSATSKQAYAFQGETKARTKTGDNTEFQTVVISDYPIAFGSTVVSVGSNIWTEVSDFMNSGPTSKHYTLEYDYKGQATVNFGDGTFGAKPGTGATISVLYRVCNGAEGNISPGDMEFVQSYAGITSVTNQAPAEATLKYAITSGVSEIEVEADGGINSFADTGIAYVEGDSFSYTSKSGNKFMGVSGLEDAHAIGATVTYSNTYSIGMDAETNKEAKMSALRYNRVKSSANSLTDYEYLARRVAGVARAKAMNNNNVITVQVVPADAGLASSNLLSTTLNYLTPRKNARHSISVVQPKYVYVDVTIEVTPAASYSFVNDVKPAVLDAVQEFLHPLTTKDDNLYYQNGWGTTVKKASLLYKVMSLRDSVLVSNANITTFKRSSQSSGSSDITLSPDEITHIGKIVVVNMGINSLIEPGTGVGVSDIITMPKIAGIIT